MDNLKPTQIMLMVGGLVLLISTFLAWRDFGPVSWNGWETDTFGLQGIFIALIGLAIGGGVAAQTFANVTLPDNILGLGHDQLHLSLGVTAFVVTFGQQFASDAGIGILLGWIASAVIIAAAIMDMKAEPASPPTQF